LKNRYTYIPTLKYLETKDLEHRVPSEIRKLIASFASFAYVYVWHGVMFDVLVWSLLNFIGITIERAGSYIKRRVDSSLVR
jgi:D-alanyl-lipoteichoic acid acyltransferase DltB (MBOAT superfamily)